MPALYSTKAHVTGGRNGKGRTEDGLLDVALAMPKELGGAGGATNPEQLFAVGYAACFESALRFVARKQKLPLQDASVTSTVQLLPNGEGFRRDHHADAAAPDRGSDREAVCSLLRGRDPRFQRPRTFHHPPRGQPVQPVRRRRGHRADPDQGAGRGGRRRPLQLPDRAPRRADDEVEHDIEKAAEIGDAVLAGNGAVQAIGQAVQEEADEAEPGETQGNRRHGAKA